jgi:hypothetical protein
MQVKKLIVTAEEVIFPFGKYINQSALEVLEIDPSYILWWDTMVEPLPKDLIELAQKAKDLADEEFSDSISDMF